MVDLFEGRLSYKEITEEIPLSRLVEMQKIKEEQLAKEAKRMENELKEREASKKDKVISNVKH